MIGNELRKLFCTRSVLLSVMGLLIANVVLLCLLIGRDPIPAEDFKAIYAQLQGKSNDQAQAEVLQQYEKLREQWKLAEGACWDEMELYAVILDEITAITSYDDYLTGIDEAAARMQQSSLFGKPASFSYRNIRKTPSDFAHLKGIELNLSPSKGIELATDFPVTDGIAACILLLTILTLVMREKEQNQLLLYHTTFHGRGRLGLAKLCACFTIGIAAAVLLYGCNLLICGSIYGLGDLSRPIQSVHAMNGSCFQLTVGAYLGLFLLAKSAVYCLLAAVMYLTAVFAKSAPQCFGTLTIVGGISAALWMIIPSESIFCLLKYVNLLAFLDTQTLFAVYQNRNVFGFPVGQMTVFAVSVCIMLTVISLFSVKLFARMSVIRNQTKRPHLRWIRHTHLHLFSHECYKVFIGGKVLWIIAALLLCRVLFYTPLQVSYTPDEIYYRQYMTVLAGEHTAEKEAWLMEEKASLDAAQSEYMAALQAAGENTLLVVTKYQSILAPKAALEETIHHAEYLRSVPDGAFFYDRGYRLLTSGAENKTHILLATLMSVLLLCCVSGIFTREYHTQMHLLLQSSYKGQKPVLICKLCIAFFIVLMVYLAVYVPYFMQVLSAYGMVGADAPAASMEHLQGWNCSVGGYLILLSLKRFAGFLLQTVTLWLLSHKLQNTSALIAAAGVLFLLPLLLVWLGIPGMQHLLWNPLIL